MGHSLDATLARTAFPPEGGETECRIEVDPDHSGSGSLPLHIVFCIDASGSMSGSKVKQAKRGVEDSVKNLNSEDKFAVVSFSSSANVIQSPTSGGTNRGNISKISASGGTHIINGLEQSRSLLDNMGSGQSGLFSSGSSGQEAVTWIALITDGRPGSVSSALSSLVNGVTDDKVSGKVAKHRKVAEALNDQGISVHTAGVGSSYGEDIIEAISARSGGKWNHYSSGSGIETFFNERIEVARNVVATNPTLKFEPQNGAAVSDVRRAVPQMAEVDYNIKHSTYIIEDFPDIRDDLAPEYLFNLDIANHEIDPDVPIADITLDIGSKTLSETVSVEYAIDEDMATEMDTGIKMIEEEAEEVDGYLGRKDDYDKSTKEQESNKIARRRGD